VHIWLRIGGDIPIIPPYAFMAWAEKTLNMNNRILLVVIIYYAANYWVSVLTY
jgi:hypothetical protein